MVDLLDKPLLKAELQQQQHPQIGPSAASGGAPPLSARLRPLASVITIVRNEVDRIETTIQSVLGQTYPRLEYVLIDGSSTDGTMDVVRKYAGRISQIRSEPDHGISDAFNKGAQIATGDLIIFLNAGDSFVSPDALEAAINLIPDNADIRRSIFYGDACYVCASGASLLEADHTELGKRNSLCHQSVLVGTDVQRNYPYDERLSMFMDYDVWLRCMGRCPFIKVPTLLSNFTAGGVTGADASGVRYRIERTVVQLLNRQAAPTLKTIAETLGIVFGFVLKRKIRQVIGPRGFSLFKKWIGRNTPSSWAPPPPVLENGSLSRGIKQ